MSATDYVSAPNSVGPIALTLSLTATIVGGGMFFSVAALGFVNGLLPLALGVSYLIGSVVLGTLAPALRRLMHEHEVDTLFGVIDVLYPQSTVRISTLLAVGSVIAFALMLAVQYVSLGTIWAHTQDLKLSTSIALVAGVIAVVSTVLYSAFGGFLRDIWTDVVQMVFVAGGLVVLVGQLAAKDVTAQVQALPIDFFVLGSGEWIFFIGSLLFVAPTFLVRYDLWQRVRAAKSDRAATWSFVTSGLLAFACFVVFGLIGVYTRATVGESIEGEFAAVRFFGMMAEGSGYGILTAAFLAAVMSSADTFLGVAGLSLARLWPYRRGELDRAKDRVSVKKLRALTGLVGVTALALAVVTADMVDLFTQAFGVLLVFLPAVAGGLVAAEKSEKAARWSIYTGMTAFLPAAAIIPREAFLVGLVVATSVYTVIKFMEKKSRSHPQSR